MTQPDDHRSGPPIPERTWWRFPTGANWFRRPPVVSSSSAHAVPTTDARSGGAWRRNVSCARGVVRPLTALERWRAAPPGAGSTVTRLAKLPGARCRSTMPCGLPVQPARPPPLGSRRMPCWQHVNACDSGRHRAKPCNRWLRQRRSRPEQRCDSFAVGFSSRFFHCRPNEKPGDFRVAPL